MQRSTMTAGERAYATLLDEIQSGALAAGTVLAEVEQARRLGVSRTPLRAALSRLAADGLVAQASPRVTVVTDVAPRDIRALFAVRRALEESAARTAAGRIRSHPGAGAEFAALAARFRDPQPDADAYYGTIAEFDAALDAAVGNDYLAAALRTVRTHLVRVRRLARDNPERLTASAGEHALIAEAVAAGDEELAAHATHVHLHNALTAILASLDDAPVAAGAGRTIPGAA